MGAASGGASIALRTSYSSGSVMWLCLPWVFDLPRLLLCARCWECSCHCAPPRSGTMLRALCAALALLCGVAHCVPAPPPFKGPPTQAFQVLPQVFPFWATASPPPKPPSPAPRAQPAVVPQPQQSSAMANQVTAPAVGRLASPGRPAVTPLPAGARRVCVFDFDDTLKNEGNVVADDAAWVVQACVANGYDIGIATAGCRPDFVRSFLHRRVDADIFNEAFLNSSAMQFCQTDKTVSLTSILQYYGLDDARQCAILFDDLQYNCRYATSVGMGARWVDNGKLQYQVGEPGIRAADFFAAQAQWSRTCPDAAPPPVSTQAPL